LNSVAAIWRSAVGARKSRGTTVGNT